MVMRQFLALLFSTTLSVPAVGLAQAAPGPGGARSPSAREAPVTRHGDRLFGTWTLVAGSCDGFAERGSCLR
jgi:hypothetical protein